jgi:hypothetical protein
MKVSTAILAVSVTAQEKKVPPRHPSQRLNRLNQFAEEWLTDNLSHLPSVGRWVEKFNANAGRMTRAFGRSKCGFYDQTMMPHGGPDPNPNLRPNGRPRNRRQAEDSSYEGSDGSLLRYDKSNPMLGIKQITTGYRKWAQRFINECHGQRKFNYQVERMSRWFQKLGQHYVAHQQSL